MSTNDAKGRVRQATTDSVTQWWSYDAAGLLIFAIDGNGTAFLQSYDSRGNPTVAIAGYGTGNPITTEIEWNLNDQISAMISAMV